MQNSFSLIHLPFPFLYLCLADASKWMNIFLLTTTQPINPYKIYLVLKVITSFIQKLSISQSVFEMAFYYSFKFPFQSNLQYNRWLYLPICYSIWI